MHLDEIVGWIDSAFGDTAPRPAPGDEEALKRIFGDSGFQRYLKDQVNRQIIRDYLTNAVVLGEIPEGGLAAFASQMMSEDSRATLALFMLMSSVEEAKDLPLVSGDTEGLKPLAPAPKQPPYIKLVTN
ncbi:MAG: hypothetical protein KDI17_03410 [Halioglobus sp.]|nr:hypothetical protein [Halioglobus sp.]